MKNLLRAQGHRRARDQINDPDIDPALFIVYSLEGELAPVRIPTSRSRSLNDKLGLVSGKINNIQRRGRRSEDPVRDSLRVRREPRVANERLRTRTD